MSDASLEISPFQQRVLSIPEKHDLFLGGGRGGGKSYTLALLALRHAEMYGQASNVLFIRQTYPGLRDFENITRELFGNIYGTGASFNAAAHTWRFPGGGYFELGQLADASDYSKYQGRSFGLLLVDEAGEFGNDLALVDRLRSNLRGKKGMPVRVALAANPGGPSHSVLSSRYVFTGAAPWEPFVEPKSQRTWVYAPSTLTDNIHLDQAEYARQLEASCPTDPELLRAWLSGDWSVVRGAYFASVLSDERNAFGPWNPEEWTPTARRRYPEPPGKRYLRVTIEKSDLPTSGQWGMFLAHDFGVSAPSVTFVCARSPGCEGPDGRWYSRDSVLLLDEYASNEPGSLSRGMGYTVPRLAEEIIALAERWGVDPMGSDNVGDDSMHARSGSGAAASIADEFRHHGVRFAPARKGDRRSGWEIMRRMFADAGKPDRPGLYVSRACEYFWSTVPFLGRDPRRVDDVDSRGPDHAADAARYALLRDDRGHVLVHCGLNSIL